MKHIESKRIFLMLVLVTFFVLVGCQKSSDSNRQEQVQSSSVKDSLIGAWIIDDLSAETWSWENEFIIGHGSNSCPYTLSLYEDGSYSFTRGDLRRYTVVSTGEHVTDFDETDNTYTGFYQIINDGAVINFSEMGSHSFSVSGSTLKLIGSEGFTFSYKKL